MPTCTKEKRAAFLKAVREKIGLPYRWAGNGPDSYDCSGLVVVCLREIGCEIGDHSAADLAKIFAGNKVDKKEALPGALFFYGDLTTAIEHVMVVLNRWDNGTFVMCGARGGTSITKDLDIATRQGAFVDVTCGDYNYKKFKIAVDPFK
jgi:uncharacterized protein YfaT (DUF1175 family)